MTIKIKIVGGEPATFAHEITALQIIIGSKTFRVNETVDGKLTINKTDDEGKDSMNIHPVAGNEIEIS
jgi:hypothetical protein